MFQVQVQLPGGRGYVLTFPELEAAAAAFEREVLAGGAVVKMRINGDEVDRACE